MAANLLNQIYDVFKYRIIPELTFASSRANLGKKLGQAAWKTAAFGAKATAAGVYLGATRVILPSMPKLVNDVVEGSKTLAKAFYNWGMGGEGLFKVINNPHIAAAERVGASKEVLKKLGLAFQEPGESYADFLVRRAASRELLVFNPTLRKRLVYGTLAVGVIGALNTMNGPGGHDPRVPVYDNSDNMGADGDLALSMYYNNR
jgi:hypothetical protein